MHPQVLLQRRLKDWKIGRLKLAADLGITYAIDPNKQIVLEQKAAQYLEDAMSTDNEFSSFSFYPEDRR